MTDQERETPLGYGEALGAAADNPPTPRQSGHRVRTLGREWSVATCEMRIKAQFEQWVRDAVEADIDRAEATNPDRARRKEAVYQESLAAGRYTWNGSAVRSALTDTNGLVHLFYLLVRRCHPEFTPAMAHAAYLEDGRAVGRAIAWSLGNGRAAGAAESPAAARTGTTTAEPPTLDGD